MSVARQSPLTTRTPSGLTDGRVARDFLVKTVLFDMPYDADDLAPVFFVPTEAQTLADNFAQG